MSELTTTLALDAVAWGRAKYDSYGGRVALPIVCADGFSVSVQASSWHYANDSSGKAPYWNRDDAPIAYPFVTFEIGRPSEKPRPRKVWRKYDSGGVWAWVPREVVAALLDKHGGAVSWMDRDAAANG